MPIAGSGEKVGPCADYTPMNTMSVIATHDGQVAVFRVGAQAESLVRKGCSKQGAP